MNLDTVEQRHKIMDDLVKKSFKLDEMFLHDEDLYNDWLSNIEIMGNLISLEKMIHTERIFLDALDEMKSVPDYNSDGKEIYMDIVSRSLDYYVDTMLLHLLEYTAYDILDDWQFETEDGKKFHKDVTKKLTALIDKYIDLYNI